MTNMTNTTPYEELLTFAGDYRVKLATVTTIVYERLGQSKYPLDTTDVQIVDVPEENWVEDTIDCQFCDFEWRARYVDCMETLACPHCIALAVPNSFAKEYIESRFGERIESLLRERATQ